MAVLTPPPIPSDALAGDWALEEDYEGNQIWVWEEDVPTSPEVEEAALESDALDFALEASVRERRQVCRRTHGAQFSETLGIVALARAGRGQ
mgnify:CR=1 FL=1